MEQATLATRPAVFQPEIHATVVEPAPIGTPASPAGSDLVERMRAGHAEMKRRRMSAALRVAAAELLAPPTDAEVRAAYAAYLASPSLHAIAMAMPGFTKRMRTDRNPQELPV
mgnify:CR=1 FL=1